MLNLNDIEDSIKPKSDTQLQLQQNQQKSNGFSSSFDSYLDSTVTTTTTNTNSSEMTSFESMSSSSSSPPPPPLLQPLPNLSLERQQSLLDNTNLDIIDLVNNDLINIDQEYLWLCDPKTAQLNNTNKLNNKSQQQQTRLKQDISDNSLNANLNDTNNNSSSTNNYNNNSSTSSSISNNTNMNNSNNINSKSTLSSKKNPYKWLMEDFEDKNLDKVKRTLLVALDDISKGFNRRSRSVSTSRTPYMQSHPNNNYYPNNNPNNHYNMYYQNGPQQQYYYYQSPNDNEHYQQIHNQQLQQQIFNDLNDLHIKRAQPTTQIHQQSKSIESLLNETTDHISEADENEQDEEESELNRTYSLETETDLKNQLNSIKSTKNNNNKTSVDSTNLHLVEIVENNSLHAEFVKIRSNTHDIIKPSSKQTDETKLNSLTHSESKHQNHQKQLHLKLFESKLISHQFNQQQHQYHDQHKIYSLKPRDSNCLNYFDNSILFKKHRSRSRARQQQQQQHQLHQNNDDLNWLTNKQNDFESLKDIMYSSLINDTQQSTRRSSIKSTTSTTSSSSSDTNYYKNRPIEYLDENVFFEDENEKAAARAVAQSKLEQNLIEIRTPDEDLEASNTIESLIEELDAELKKSIDDDSLCSSPIVALSSNQMIKSNNKCTCSILCYCQCHSIEFNAKSNRFRFGSNSSSITSSHNSGSLLLQTNSPSIRRVSYESLEWDISLDNQINSPKLLNQTEENKLADGNNNSVTNFKKSTRVNSTNGSVTMVKKKTALIGNKMINRMEDFNLSTIDSIDISTSSNSQQTDQGLVVVDNDSVSNNQLDDQQYEDITDVQVIAKMQEEALRQSVLNINKIVDKGSHQQRTGYSTATIVKRTHNVRPALQTTSNYDYETNQQQLRRDSASSSDHSSISSTGSPYASHVNVNEFFWDEDVINDSNTNTQEEDNYLNKRKINKCTCCSCAKSNLVVLDHQHTLIPCNDHHLHYHHEPIIEQQQPNYSLLLSSQPQLSKSTTSSLSSSPSHFNNKPHFKKPFHLLDLHTKSKKTSSKPKSSTPITTTTSAPDTHNNVGLNTSRPVSRKLDTTTILSNQRTSSQTPTYQKTATQKSLNFTSNSNVANNPIAKLASTNSHSRSTTPSSKPLNSSSNLLTSSNSNILKHESRLPTPRSKGLIEPSQNGNKPPPSPFQTSQSSNVTSVNTSSRTGRTLMAYGGQRSATTSIVPMIASANSSSSINNMNQNWPHNHQQQQQQYQHQSKFTKLQKQQQILPKQPQQTLQSRSSTSQSMSRTSTNQSIASSNSSSNIISTNPPTISPSSSSSVSTSSSMHQIAPLNSSSPRSRHTSPSLNQNLYNYSTPINNITNNNKIVISPSGLLTDGPLGRSRPLISPSPLRDRSNSPVYDVKKTQQQQQPIQLVNQLNIGSNSSLHTIQESKIPTSSPMMIKKHQVQQLRKSFLPQPVQHIQSQQVHSSQVTTQSTLDPNK